MISIENDNVTMIQTLEDIEVVRKVLTIVGERQAVDSNGELFFVANES